MCVNGLGLTSVCENVNVKLNIFMWFYVAILYIKATMVSVCLSVWAVPGKFFQSLPVPYGASPDVTDSRKKRNQG